MRKFIPVEEVAKERMKNPAFVAEYNVLEDEFAGAAALTKARRNANMTQGQRGVAAHKRSRRPDESPAPAG
jgi:hypothetical protein